jgi:hypothetical protein
MVFGLVPGPGLKGSTLFFPLDFLLFQGGASGRGKDTPPLPARPEVHQPP